MLVPFFLLYLSFSLSFCAHHRPLASQCWRSSLSRFSNFFSLSRNSSSFLISSSSWFWTSSERSLNFSCHSSSSLWWSLSLSSSCSLKFYTRFLCSLSCATLSRSNTSTWAEVRLFLSLSFQLSLYSFLFGFSLYFSYLCLHFVSQHPLWEKTTGSEMVLQHRMKDILATFTFPSAFSDMKCHYPFTANIEHPFMCCTKTKLQQQSILTDDFWGNISLKWF